MDNEKGTSGTNNVGVTTPNNSDEARTRISDKINGNREGLKNGEVSEIGETKEVSKTQVQTKELTDNDKEAAIQEYLSSALKQGIIGFDGYKIKKTYPCAYQLIKEYMEEKSQGEMEDDIIVGVFLYSPRTILFNFFDDKKFYVNIIGKKGSWYFTINDAVVGGFTSRVECEVEAFHAAFTSLEKTLQNNF